MIGEGLEPSADMRILDRERERLGAAPPPPGVWITRDLADLPDVPEAPPPALSGAILDCRIDADRDRELTAGSFINLRIELANTGSDDAHGIIAGLSGRPGIAYRPGSLLLDGRSLDDEPAAMLFSDGYPVGSLASHGRCTIELRCIVEPGSSDVPVVMTVRAHGAAIVGPAALRLRRNLVPSAFAAVLESQRIEEDESPFYELDPEEALEYEAADAALTPLVERPQPVRGAAEAVPPPPGLLVPDEPPPAPVRTPVATARPVQTIPVAGGPVYRVGLRKSRIMGLAALFLGERSLGMIAHYLLLSALATVEPIGGNEDDHALVGFVDAQNEKLSRALIAARLGREIDPDTIAVALPPFPPFGPEFFTPVAAARISDDLDGLPLYRAFRESEIALLQRTVADAELPAFMRGVEILVGTCARGVAVAGSEGRACEHELREYASMAHAEVNRLFVLSRLTRRSALFPLVSSAFDERAQRLIARLVRLAPS